MSTETNARIEAVQISDNSIKMGSDSEKSSQISDPTKDFFDAIRKNEPQDAEFSEIEEVQNTVNEHNLFDHFSDKSSSTDIALYKDVENVEGEPLFQTGEVAKMFNVTRQTIRNTADFFVDILSDERGSNGCKLFTNEDIAIIKKIQELKDLQYSRRDIREILINQGVSAKGKSLREINIEKDTLPMSGDPKNASFTNLTNEDFQLTLKDAFNDTMKNLQSVMVETLSKSLVDLESNIKQSFLADINIANDNLGKLLNSSIDATKEQLLEVIQLQNNKIIEQHKEIIRLKGTILNINHTTLATDKKLEIINNLPTGTEIQEFKKDISEANTISQDTIKEIRSQLNDSVQNNAKQIEEIVKKQNTSLSRIEGKISNIANENPIKFDTKKFEEYLGNKYENATNKIIKSNKDSFENIQALFEKILEENDNKIDEALLNDVNEKLKIANNEISQLKKNNTKLENKNKANELVIMEQAKQLEKNEGIVAESEILNDQNKALTRKVEIAQELIKRVTNENDELKNKVKISKTIISKQDSELVRLKLENSAKQNKENVPNPSSVTISQTEQSKQMQNTAKTDVNDSEDDYLENNYEEKNEDKPEKKKGFFFKKPK